MSNVKRNWVLTIATLALLAVPAAAQDDRISLRDALNRQHDDIGEEALTPEQEAVIHYQQGVALVQRAIAQEQKANENEGAKRDKLLKKAAKSFEGAAREFQTSTKKNPAQLESWSGLGWVCRRTAQWDAAVKAYDKALSIEPNLTAAVEGRAEAYLALNRIEEVRLAYAHLERADQKNARQLLGAVENWVKQQHSAGQADTDAVRTMMEFVVEKRQAS